MLDHQSDDKFVEIGHQNVGVNLEALRQVDHTFALKPPNEKNTFVGNVIVHAAKVFEKPTFEAYVEGGLEIHLAAAIDFTGSNGSPESPTSLHYVAPGGASPYQQAMGAVAAVLAPFDHDQKIQARHLMLACAACLLVLTRHAIASCSCLASGRAPSRARR